jgi:NADH-quinone oxidoreductase subunit G
MRDRATGEAILNEDGSPKIGWMPRPAIGCATNASPGLHIKTDSEIIRDCRNGVMEFLLVNHPLDCPICDQAGECRLQEFATDYGRGYSRFVEQKNVKPKRTRLGPRVTLDDERCILCSRCIRFMKEVPGEDVLGFTERGSYSTLTTYPGRELDSNYSLNTVDICPVGALTSTDFRFKMRVWFLKSVRSICTESSVGTNTEVWAREGKIYRITPRRNDAVNDTWMTDSGRSLYKEVSAENRLTQGTINGAAAPAEALIKEAVERLKGKRVAIVGSSHLSVEEQFLLKEIQMVLGAKVFWRSHLGEEDGLLLSADHTPNLRGAVVTGLIDSVPGTDFSALSQALTAGEFDAVFALREDLVAGGVNKALLDKISLVYLGTQANETAAEADVFIPGLTVFERSGSFINQQFRLQNFLQVVPGPAGVFPDLASLSGILNGLGHNNSLVSPDAVWKGGLVDRIPEVNGQVFRVFPGEGIALDPKPWLDLDFPEKKTLKYDAEAFRNQFQAAAV